MNLLDYPEQLRIIDFYSKKIYNGLYPASRTHVDLQDLVQAGHIALWKATKKYDPTKTIIQFSVYTRMRIYGEMIDTVRTFCPVEFRAGKDNTFKKSIKFVSFDIAKHDRSISDDETDNAIDVAKIINRIKSKSSPKEKRIFSQYLRGVPQIDTSREEGVSEATVSNHVKRVIERVKHEYEY